MLDRWAVFILHKGGFGGGGTNTQKEFRGAEAWELSYDENMSEDSR